MKNAIDSGKSAILGQKLGQKFPGATILLTEYLNEGYCFKLLKRQGIVGLFQQFTDSGKPVAYEVILIQSYRGKEFAPDTEGWGTHGWSYIKHESALRIFEKMTEDKAT